MKTEIQQRTIEYGTSDTVKFKRNHSPLNITNVERLILNFVKWVMNTEKYFQHL